LLCTEGGTRNENYGNKLYKNWGKKIKKNEKRKGERIKYY